MTPPTTAAELLGLEALGSEDLREALELRQLLSLARAGLPLAPLRVLPPSAETHFFALNNLPARLEALFAGMDLRDPDEDDLEERAPEAQTLVRTHYLLDETIDRFYEALETLPPRLRLRRAGSAGVSVAKGRPALLALKATWADAWSPEALGARLRAGGALLPPARPILIGPDDAPAGAELSERVQVALGSSPPVFAVEDALVSRLVAGSAGPSLPAPASAA